MFVLAIGILARAAAGPAQGLLVVTGHQNTTAAVMFISVVLNAGLNLALIPRFGLLGAAAATASAFALEALVLSLAANRIVARPAANSEVNENDTAAE
jgi:O-antigen/teichoic acid export membrane protein